MEGFGVTVLSVLNEKDHQERNDRRARIHDELPRVREVKEWTTHSPDHQSHDSGKEHVGMAD